MKTNSRRSLLPFFLFLFSLTSLSAQEGGFYRISHPEHPEVEPSYLFGTFHLMKSGYLRDHYPAVQKAFEQAQTVVVETVIDSSKLLQLSSMAMLENAAVTDYLSDQQWDSLTRRLSSYPYPETALRRLKPMQLLLMLSMKEYQELETPLQAAEGLPVDLYFAAQAQKKGQDLRPLETMMKQMKMLYQKLPDSVQAQMLAEALEEAPSIVPLTEKMVGYYRKGQLEALGRLFQENQESFQEMSFLVEPRNKHWMPQLEESLRDGNAFIAVGALHLPLDGGLLHLLEKAGYQLKALPRQ